MSDETHKLTVHRLGVQPFILLSVVDTVQEVVIVLSQNALRSMENLVFFLSWIPYVENVRQN